MPGRLFLLAQTDDRTRLAMPRLFYAQSVVSLVAAVLLVALHLGYAWDAAPRQPLLAWAMVFAALVALRARWRSQVMQLDDAALAAALPRWEQRARQGGFATGLLWSVALLTVFRAVRPSSQMYAAMLSCVTVVASINVMAPRPRAFLALMVPVTLTLAALFASLGGWAAVYDALLAVAGTALATGLLLRHSRLLQESYAMRFEREALLA